MMQLFPICYIQRQCNAKVAPLVSDSESWTHTASTESVSLWFVYGVARDSEGFES